MNGGLPRLAISDGSCLTGSGLSGSTGSDPVGSLEGGSSTAPWLDGSCFLGSAFNTLLGVALIGPGTTDGGRLEDGEGVGNGSTAAECVALAEEPEIWPAGLASVPVLSGVWDVVTTAFVVWVRLSIRSGAAGVKIRGGSNIP